MTASFYQIRQCENPLCGLRYPITEGHPYGERCPLCLGATRLMLQRLLNPEAPPLPPGPSPANGRGGQVEALLDNIRSAWNVGAIFRTADGLGVEKLHLCGITPTPEVPAVAKTALGAEQVIPWSYARNALRAAEALKDEGHLLWALEQDERAVEIGAAAAALQRSWQVEPRKKVILIVGNEVTGVDPALLELCDQVVYIPMGGQKRSFNVEVAFGMAIHALIMR